MLEYTRKAVKLRATGGSRSVVLPKAWLRDLGIHDHVDLVRSGMGIVVQAPQEGTPSIEDEPEFAQFLSFLAKDALAHPERSGDVGELVAGDEELFRNVHVEPW